MTHKNIQLQQLNKQISFHIVFGSLAMHAGCLLFFVLITVASFLNGCIRFLLKLLFILASERNGYHTLLRIPVQGVPCAAESLRMTFP